jgi:hypothetical protein
MNSDALGYHLDANGHEVEKKLCGNIWPIGLGV